MRIAFDVSYIQTKPHGYRRYATELLHALTNLTEGHQWLLHGWSASLDKKWIEALRKPGVELSLLRVPGQLKRLYWNTVRTPTIERLLGAFDIFHSTDPLLPATRRKAIITVHDVVYARFPQWVERRVVRWGKHLRSNIARADAIVAVSSNTKRDVVELFSVPESKVHVIYPIVSPIFTHHAGDQDEDVLIRYNLLQPYILFVATIEPRKNVMCLLEAYDRMPQSLRNEVRLVLVGRQGWKSEETVRAIVARQRAGHVCWLQEVSDAELPALYRRALMFVYPSLYEGFGLPVAEALACGTPVIASRVASIPEIAGNAAVLVEPGDADALSTTMASLANDGAQRRHLQRRGPELVCQFSAQHAVEKILSLYKSLS